MPDTHYPTPEQAEAAFYSAFEDGSLRDMMEVWADDEGIVCIHPGAPYLQGVDMIREGWRQILESSSDLEFNLEYIHTSQDSWLSVHVLREEISIGGEFTGAMLVTNIYRRFGEGWRMMLHHASPEPDSHDEPDDRYEGVVLH